MKKQLIALLSGLILITLLAGCNTLIGNEEQSQKLEPLNIADWPTAVPEQAKPTATPFPKATLNPTPTSSSASLSNEATTKATEIAAELDLTGNPIQIAQQISQITGGLSPTGVAQITSDDTLLQAGPTVADDSLELLAAGDMAAMLGQSSDGEWLYVIIPSLAQGWLPVSNTKTLVSLGQPPIFSADEVEAVAAQDADVSLDDLNLAEQPSSTVDIFSELPPAGTALVKSDGTALRSGPSTNYGPVQTLNQGDLAGILGKDSSSEWLYISTLDPTLGWLPVDSLRVLGDIAEMRVLPPNPLAAFLGQSSTASKSGGQVAPVKPIDPDDLDVIASATVNNAALNLRQRPGSSYKLLNTLSDGDVVEILALNRDKEWTLLKDSNGQLGWGSMDYLNIDGPIANAPQLRTLEPGANHPPDQIAPIAGAASSGGVAASSVSTSAGAVDSQSDSSTSGPVNTLAPVTTGQIIEKVDMRQGPGSNYSESHTLNPDDPITVRAVDDSRAWALVEALNNKIGWAPVSALQLDGSLDSAPAIISGWITSNDIEVNSGPGIFYDAIGKLGINSPVSVLGLNEGRSWVLGQTLDGNLGWVSIRFVDISASLSDVPTITDLPVAAESVPGQEQTIPAPSGPPSGQMVIQTASGDDILLINADGTGLKILTKGIDPALSYDGQQVAFTRWQGDNGALWVIDTDGTNERVISNEIRKVKGPDWSPDGSQIILNYQHGGRLEDKERCKDLSTGTPSIPRNATSMGVRQDGFTFYLCYTIPPDEQWSLRLVNVVDGSHKDLYGGLYAFRPTFDPGQPWRVVSDSGNGLLGIDINRAEFRQPLSDIAGDGSPAFSPDGRLIAVSTDVQGGHNIFRMNADGSGRVRLTQTPLWVPLQPDGDNKQWHNVSPVWSPDGSRIAFLTNREGHWEVWIMSADGSDQQPLFSTEINDQLEITYNFVDEKTLSWR